MSTERIGAKIKAAREELGWTHEKLAVDSGVVTRTLQDIEYGVSKDPGFDRVLSIAVVLTKALRIPLAVFLDVPEEDLKSRDSLFTEAVEILSSLEEDELRAALKSVRSFGGAASGKSGLKNNKGAS